MFKEILNPKEEIELKKILDNKALLGGLKKAFLAQLYYSGTIEKGEAPNPRTNFICNMLYTEDMGTVYKVSDKEIGGRVRASVEGIRLVEAGFGELETLRDVKVDKKEIKNEAR